MPDIGQEPQITSFDADPHRVAGAHRPFSAAVFDTEQQAWLVLRHPDVTQLLRDPTLKKDPFLAKDGPYTETLRGGDFSILFMDDPDHQRLRGLVTQAFSKRATEAFRPRIQAMADELLKSVDETAGPVDIISTFAVPLPIHVIAEILGIDTADQVDFKR
jgi:cytochrome P450